MLNCKMLYTTLYAINGSMNMRNNTNIYKPSDLCIYEVTRAFHTICLILPKQLKHRFSFCPVSSLPMIPIYTTQLGIPTLPQSFYWLPVKALHLSIKILLEPVIAGLQIIMRLGSPLCGLHYPQMLIILIRRQLILSITSIYIFSFQLT